MQAIMHNVWTAVENSQLSTNGFSERRENEFMVKNGEFFAIEEINQRGMSITTIAKGLNRDSYARIIRIRTIAE